MCFHIFENVFRFQALWLWVVVTLLFWLCLNALIFSQNCIMQNWKTEDGCGRGDHVASYSVIYGTCSRQILPALQVEHTVEYVIHYILKEISILSLLARTIVMF